MRRVVVIVAVVSLTLIISSSVAQADQGGPINRVWVQNMVDGSARHRSRADVAEIAGPTVTPENSAFAYATCTDCRTVAVAVQVVMVVGPVSDFRPVNFAVAVNYLCVRCQTFAYANQVLLPVPGEVEMHNDTEDQIRALKKQIASVAASTETFDQMTSHLDALTRQLVSVITDALARTATTVTPETHRDVELSSAA
jgi:putative peptide zinc metalloprotease protein